MDRIININVSGNHLTKDSKNAGTRGEANITILRITFDEGWDKFDKKITFWDARGLNPVEIYLRPSLAESKRVYRVPIPFEPMAEAGELTFVIEGTLDDKVQRSLSDRLEVKDAPITTDANNPVPPTEGELAQVRRELEKIRNADWLQNDETQPDYVKNRPFYTVKKSIIKDTYVADDGLFIINLTPDAEIGKTYKYNINGNVGEFVCDHTYDRVGDLGFLYMDSPEWSIITNFGTEVFADIYEEVAVCLPEKYIPDTIARVRDISQNKLDGSAEGSIQSINSVAQAPNSVSLGSGCIAGVKAYYISSIDFKNKKIYLTKTQPDAPSLTEHTIDTSILEDEEFYEVGDVFSIISQYHYPACGTITAIDANRVISYSGDLPFTEFGVKGGADDFTFNVPQKYNVGCITLGDYGIGAGLDNIIAGKAGIGLGRGGVVLDSYGAVIGYLGRAGYAATSLNAYTEALANNSLAFGQRTITHFRAKNGVAGGFYTIAGSENQLVYGKYNIVDFDDKYIIILGNGDGYSHLSNAFTVDWFGNGWFSGSLKIGGRGYDDPKAEFVATKKDIEELAIRIGTVNDELEAILAGGVD